MERKGPGADEQRPVPTGALQACGPRWPVSPRPVSVPCWLSVSLHVNGPVDPRGSVCMVRMEGSLHTRRCVQVQVLKGTETSEHRPDLCRCSSLCKSLDSTRQLLSGFFVCLFVCFVLFYFWLHWVFVAACGLSLVVASEGYSSLRCAGFSLRWLFLLWSTGSRVCGLQ